MIKMQKNFAILKKDSLGAAPKFAIVLTISHPFRSGTVYIGKFTSCKLSAVAVL